MTNEVIAVLSQFATYSLLDRCDAAVEVLQELGLQPNDLLSALAVDDADIRVLAMEVLAELEPAEATLPAVIYSLDDSDRLVRLAALRPLVRFGIKAVPAIPILEGWLESDDRFDQLLAADAICQIDIGQVQKILPFLIEGLESGCPSDKSLAANAIGHLGETGSPALEALENLMWDECVSVQCSAASAISKITSDPRVEISVAVDLLGAEDWIERYVGAEHLGWTGAVAVPALPNLRLATENDEDDAVRERARLAIEQIEGS